MSAPTFAAVDLGASSGRVIAGRVADEGIDLEVVHRFPNGPVERHGRLRWDIQRLYGEVLTGLEMLYRRHPDTLSIGIDAWGVDYGLLDRTGGLLADPIAYRDQRAATAVERVHARIAPDDLYRITGTQHLPFNTIYQLAADQQEPGWADAAHVILIPDLLAYWLTGEIATEATIASTTGLVDVVSGEWSEAVLDALGLDRGLLPPIQVGGARRGQLQPSVRRRIGAGVDVGVVNVGGHDTASAVAAVPARDERFAYASSGTWTLVGVEVDRPIVSESARVANFTNERAVDGRIRFLRNVGGLWLLEESLRTWADAGRPQEVAPLVAAASELPAGGPQIDIDDAVFAVPGDIPRRIADAVEARGEDPPAGLVETARCIIDSIATGIGRAVAEVEQLSDVAIDVVHVVGGGARNDLLCRGVAVATGRPVVAGPAEATALGNIAVQAQAYGVLPAASTRTRWRSPHRCDDSSPARSMRADEPTGV